MLLRHTVMKAGNVTAPHSDEGRQCYCATVMKAGNVTAPHSDEGRQCYCATVMKAGNVTAPHSTNFPVPTLMHYSDGT